MKSRWERWRTAEPPKKLTLRQAVADVIVFAVVFGGDGLITGDWDGAIGGGVGAGGGTLLYQWWNGRTAQPEYEDEDGGDDQ
ncbi:hypothetical protein OG785_17910 [Streptomyces sp. NBC_00006]|uniref:hypothetical protein n=1 Tax=Streptomyces sp. NBC_00006 TaxID=2975619 RepID=UPI002255E653|nr:hypothetical protein [Streptomyces sp. NBC_00006]MCX5532429.1 hypothetical protein [Streptomyces sp. NBC_00006]